MHRQRQIWLIADHQSNETFPIAFEGDRISNFTIGEARTALIDQSGPNVAIVDLAGCSDDALELLTAIDTLADARALRAIVIIPPECIDAVSAHVVSRELQLLCNPSMAERIAAIGFAIEGGSARLHATGDLSPPGLQSLAEEVARIARALATLASEAPAAGSDVFSDGLVGFRAETGPTSGAPVGASEVRAMIRARRQRERFLPPELFGEPAWDMLLDLFAARIERTKVAVSSLCIAAAVPPTTALRTIRTMTDSGMFNRIADPSDKRRVFIALSDAAAAAMERAVAASRPL